MSWEVAGRWSVYIPLLLVCGVLGVWLLVVVRGAALSVRDPQVGLRRVGWLFGMLLLAAVLLRAGFQSIEVWGLREWLSYENLRTVALESRWGGRWQWQAAAAAVTALGTVAMLRSPMAGGLIASLGVLGVAAALPMTGHAYGKPLAWVAQSVHILGAGFWIGTLVVVLLLPLVLSVPSRAEVASMHRYWLRAFSPLAVMGASMLVLSGGLLAFLYLPVWDMLWTDPYGQVLLVKVGLSVFVLFFGAVNYLRIHFRPDLHTDPLPRTVALEVVFALLVLAATGLLTSTAQPDMH
ncbi:MAG: CopD family protein [Acidobacteria bacterium]|nr:CopD family protein [Acidobacteriota bacterium]